MPETALPTLEHDAALAADLVLRAGRLAAQMRSAGIGGAEGLSVDRKTNITDVVSSADHAAEALVLGELTRQRPDDGVVGEEGAQSDSRNGRTWYIDPVDGTFNFVSGLSAWCSAVALEIDGRPVLGAIYHPAQDELWIGGPDYPTTLNGAPVPALVSRPLAHLPLVTYIHPDTLGREEIRGPIVAAMEATSTVRMLGSGSVEMAAVSAGRLGIWIQHTSAPWDWLPGAALIAGVGGLAAVIDVDGLNWHIAGPAAAVAELADVVRAASTGQRRAKHAPAK
jgi:myo-inositol-1(or 4)-monophosphatase